MAFTTYDTLRTSLANWLLRSDLTDYLDDFIKLGEERLARDLRVRGIETALSVTIASGVAALPSDFLELKHAYINNSPTVPLEIKDTQWILRKYPTRSADDVPAFIGVDGGNFIFGPYPDSAYSIAGAYYFKPAALSSSNATNEWTTYAPDALLWASMIATAPFIGNDERINTWRSFYNEALTAYRVQQKKQLRRGARVSYN